MFIFIIWSVFQISPVKYQICFLLLPYNNSIYHYLHVRTNHIIKINQFVFDFCVNSSKSLLRWFYKSEDIQSKEFIVMVIHFLFLNIHCALKMFPDFFVQTFEIVIDTWKFTMLLLYILWDDWPIFMISGSNEQLQQELEYILLKPDCHCWWILKRQSGREDTLKEWYAIKFCFNLGKNAKET